MTPWVLRLLVANGVMYLLTHYAMPQLTTVLWLVPALIPARPWTPVTYMFLHAGIWHIAVNMIGLYFFGPRLEARLGARRFLILYFISGLGGAALSFFMAPYTPIIGASAAIFGVFVGYAMFWPREKVYIWGVLPIEARWLVVGMTVLALFGGFGGFEPGVAHFAHLGGFVTGLLYLKWIQHSSPARRFKQRAAGAVQPTHRNSDTEAVRRWANIRREGLHEINRSEVDRLLDKVARHGPGSLTPEERAALDRFSMR
ncbi:MAG TPA: rhomboid family intramembrane serine protease [Gemmatimonadaceae bacterium]|nr:rhomboid family intramembrane serine protease [Gemmatimonadaceae bacterium]